MKDERLPTKEWDIATATNLGTYLGTYMVCRKQEKQERRSKKLTWPRSINETLPSEVGIGSIM